MIQGIVHFVELYHGEYDRERLIYSLRAYEPKFIYAAGKAEKELRGVKTLTSTCSTASTTAGASTRFFP